MSIGPELKIQNNIVKYLNKNKILNWRISATNMSNFPDLLVLYKGKFITFEVKRDERTPARQGQQLAMQRIRDHGGYAYVVWSVEQVEEAIKAIT